jgi:ornithine carbamoyltransferase
MTQHFLKISDLNKNQIQQILELSKQTQHALENKNVLFCFEKPSFRTLVGTEAALNQCGANVIHTSPDAFLGGNIVHSGIDLGQRESIKDTIRIANHYCDALFLRVFSHSTLEEVAKYAEIPVVNALCDMHHPCQAIADLFTIQEHFGTEKKLTIAFYGDATNVAFSLAEISMMFGHNFNWCGPKGYGFSGAQLSILAANNYEGDFSIVEDKESCIQVADVVVTDTHVSMGEEAAHQTRLKVLAPYQVNDKLWEHAQDHTIFLHCLPAHRGQEVSANIIDGPQSKVIQEAKNRMVTARALFKFLIK